MEHSVGVLHIPSLIPTSKRAECPTFSCSTALELLGCSNPGSLSPSKEVPMSMGCPGWLTVPLAGSQCSLKGWVENK